MTKGPNIVRMVDHSDDAAHISPITALEEAIADLGPGGEWEGRRKLLIISVDTADQKFHVKFSNAAMKTSEILAACRIVEHKALAWMIDDVPLEPGDSA